MSEYMWANIKIGGSISRPVLTHLAVTVTDIEKAIAETQTREELAARLAELCSLDIPALPRLSIVSLRGASRRKHLSSGQKAKARRRAWSQHGRQPV